MSKIPVYIRFGRIPKDGKSKVYLGDQVVSDEPGVSVWECVKANGMYYPVLPKNTNEHGISDYFSLLLYSDRPVYLVTGSRIRINGHDNEPLLMNVKIIKELSYKDMWIRDYNENKEAENCGL